VNARLLVETRRDATVVPAAAIQRSLQSTFVYVVKDDTIEVRNVVPGPAEGDDVAIDSGLSAGEVVVVEGVDRLQRGTKVAARLAGAGGAKGKQ
jgi:multidrug efflux system membrane fusion protein